MSVVVVVTGSKDTVAAPATLTFNDRLSLLNLVTPVAALVNSLGDNPPEIVKPKLPVVSIVCGCDARSVNAFDTVGVTVEDVVGLTVDGVR